MAFQNERSLGFVGALLGESRLFVRGGEARQLHPGMSQKYMGTAEVTPPRFTRGEATTQTIQSDRDTDRVRTLRIAPGQLEAGTITITKPMRPGMSTGFWEMFERDFPASFWIPAGEKRSAQDPKDFESGWLISGAFVNNIGPDNNANVTDEGTVANFFNLTIEIGYTDGNQVQRIVDIENEAAGENSATTFTGQGAVIEETDDGYRYFFVGGPSHKDSVDGKSALVWVDEFGNSTELSISTLVATEGLRRLTRVGQNLAAIVQIGAEGTGYWYIDIDTVVNATSSVAGAKVSMANFGANAHINDWYWLSPAEACVAGTDGTNAAIWTLNGLGGSVTKSSLAGISPDIPSRTGFRSVDGVEEQIVAVADEMKVVVRDTSVSNNWVNRSGSSDNGGGTAMGVNDVYMPSRNVVFIAGASTATRPTNSAAAMKYTRDFGKSYSDVAIPAGFTQIHQVAFAEADYGASDAGYFVGQRLTTGVGGCIARTVDGGNSWFTPTNQDNAQALLAIDLIDANNGIVAGRETMFVSGNTGTVDTAYWEIQPVGAAADEK